MSRHDITDDQWTVIVPLIPKQRAGPGRRRNDDRTTLNGILFVLKTGCAWEDVPRRYGSPATCWRRSSGWATDGTWERIWRVLLSQLDAQGKWYTPGLLPVAIRDVLVGDPEGKLRVEAFFWTDLQATPAQILEWAVMRWSVEVTFEEARAHLGLETQRQWSDRAIARTTPVLLALFSIVTVLALRLSEPGQIPVPMTAWYHKAEPTFADCLALVCQHLWRARFFVNSAAEPEFVQFPEAFELSLAGLSLAV
jgi:transposase